MRKVEQDDRDLRWRRLEVAAKLVDMFMADQDIQKAMTMISFLGYNFPQAEGQEALEMDRETVIAALEGLARPKPGATSLVIRSFAALGYCLSRIRPLQARRA